MTKSFIETTETHEGWQSVFSFQAFHYPAEEWLKMRWGFNAGALLDEAMDRNRLFLESQGINETLYFDENLPTRTLVIRGIKRPGNGLQMSVLGKVNAASQEQAKQSAEKYAREILSTFPHDFHLLPTETKLAHDKMAGNDLLVKRPSIVSIQRENTFIPPMRGFHYLNGFWQTSIRSNEQIWRALSNMDQATMFNINLQPTVLLEDEKELLLEIKKKVLDVEEKPAIFLPYYPWVENCIKRRLAPWKKFFLLQVHIVTDQEVDENLSRSIGSALTRDTDTSPLPGFHAMHPETESEAEEWIEDLRLLSLTPPQRRMDDLVDLDEAFSVFRLPLRPEAGLPGANFIEPSSIN
ncbi:MAG TPA: hypothetical protein PLT08_03595 [Anaerolineales bacterium]|nr:hypothetical protein [Anaerolineales bacterium]